jgi:predicted nucleic acid-binding protein
MPEVSGILVDSSIWVKFFRAPHAPEAVHLDGLLQTKVVRTCAPVRVEVLSGTRTPRERMQLHEFFRAIPLLDPPTDFWDQVEDARFALARRGHQTSLVDLMIACTARHHRAALWTLDEDFSPIRETIAFALYTPEE